MTCFVCRTRRDGHFVYNFAGFFSFLFAAFIPRMGEKDILNLLETFKILFSTHCVSCRAFVFWKLFYEKTEEDILEW